MKLTRRTIFLAAGIALLLVAAITVTSLHNRPRTPDPRRHLVILTNAYAFSPHFNTSSLSAIQSQLYGQVKRFTKAPEPYYEATIRHGSLQTDSSQLGTDGTASNVPNISYIIDIPAARQSYVVSEAGGPDYDYDILHIICPAANELKYGDFGCVDEDQ